MNFKPDEKNIRSLLKSGCRFGKRQIMRLVELTFLCQTLKNTKKLIVF